MFIQKVKDIFSSSSGLSKPVVKPIDRKQLIVTDTEVQVDYFTEEGLLFDASFYPLSRFSSSAEVIYDETAWRGKGAVEFKDPNSFDQRLYDYIIERARRNSVFIEEAKDWFSKNFEGHIPDELLTIEWIATPDQLKFLEGSPTKREEYGRIYYHEGEVEYDNGERIPEERLYLELRKELMLGRSMSTNKLKVLLRIFHPQQDKGIAARERVKPAAFAVMLKSWIIGQKIFVDEALLLVETFIGLGWQAFAGFFIAYVVNDVFRQCFPLFIERRTFNGGIYDVEKRLKQLHSVLRRTQVAPVEMLKLGLNANNIQQMWYLQMLLGRFHFVNHMDVDDVKSRSDVSDPHLSYDKLVNVWSNDEFDRKHNATMRNILALAVQKSVKQFCRTSEDFRMQYASLGASGSAGPGSGDIFGIEGSINKRLMMSELKDEAFLQLLDVDNASMRNKVIIKVEAGKQRILMPGDVNHWFAEVVANHAIERQLFAPRQITLETDTVNEAHNRNRRRRRVAAKKPTLDSDYDNFNKTHKYHNFRMYYNTLADLYNKILPENIFCTIAGRDITMREIYQSAALWCGNAFTSAVMVLQDGTRVRQEHGLWSGWATTQLLNTLYNYIYFSIARMDYAAIFGEQVTDDFEVCGDDSDIILESKVQCLRLLTCLTKQGHKLNPTKQLVAGNISELLRISTTADLRQFNSVNRSIAGFIGSDLQSDVALPGPAYAVGTNEALNLMCRRGGNIEAVEDIRYPLLKYWSAVMVGDTQVSCSLGAVVSSAKTGGMECRRFNGPVVSARASIKVHEPTLDIYQQLPDRTNVNILANYVHRLLRHFNMQVSDPERMIASLKQAAYGSDLPDDVRKEAFQLRRKIIADMYSEATECEIQTDLHPRQISEHNVMLIGKVIRSAAIGRIVSPCISIPSFEGKSYLCAMYPTIFIDHDEVIKHTGNVEIHSKNVEDAGRTGNWDEVNRIVASLVPDDDHRVLLTWNKYTKKESRRSKGFLLSNPPNNIPSGRPNANTRAAIIENKDQDGVSKYNSFDERNNAIFKYIRENIEIVNVDHYSETHVNESIESLATNLRMMALGVASPADTALSTIYDVAAASMGWEMILRLALYHNPVRASRVWTTLISNIGIELTVDILMRKVHISANTAGVIPTEFRAHIYWIQWEVLVNNTHLTTDQRLQEMDNVMYHLQRAWSVFLGETIKI